jgi:hypothetical protein
MSQQALGRQSLREAAENGARSSEPCPLACCPPSRLAPARPSFPVRLPMFRAIPPAKSWDSGTVRPIPPPTSAAPPGAITCVSKPCTDPPLPFSLPAAGQPFRGLLNALPPIGAGSRALYRSPCRLPNQCIGAIMGVNPGGGTSMSSIPRADALRLVSAAHNAGAEALRGLLSLNESGRWTVGHIEVESPLRRSP